MTEAIQVGGKTLIKHGNAEHSILGKNRFYLYCEFHEQRRCYGVCAGLVDAFLENRQWVKDEESETSCVYAMRKKQCSAMSKRQLEVKLDASLFYTPREVPDGEPVKREEKRGPGYWMGWNRVGGSTQPKATTKPTPAAPKKPADTSVSYADAINEALKA